MVKVFLSKASSYLSKYWPWLFLCLLIPYSACVWINTPSHSHANPECAQYSSSLSRNNIVVASSGNAPQQNQAKHDEKVKLKAYTECSDLHAQWAMADVTFWAFGAGLAGIGLVFMTWLATRQGAQQQWISSRNGTRAYVHADTARFTNFNTPSVHVNISNTGTTPAKWFEVASYSCVYENHSSITELIDFSNLGEFAKWSGLASGMKLLAPTASINETTNVRMAMNSANKGFLVYGVIRYCTIFDETYETQFAFIAKNPSPSIMRIGDRENISYLNRPSVMLEVYKEA